MCFLNKSCILQFNSSQAFFLGFFLGFFLAFFVFEFPIWEFKCVFNVNSCSTTVYCAWCLISQFLKWTFRKIQTSKTQFIILQRYIISGQWAFHNFLQFHSIPQADTKIANWGAYCSPNKASNHHAINRATKEPTYNSICHISAASSPPVPSHLNLQFTDQISHNPINYEFY